MGLQGGAGTGRTVGADGAAAAPLAAGMRSIVSTSNGTPAARSAWVTTSAGAAGSAWGNRIVTR